MLDLIPTSTAVAVKGDVPRITWPWQRAEKDSAQSYKFITLT